MAVGRTARSDARLCPSKAPDPERKMGVVES